MRLKMEALGRTKEVELSLTNDSYGVKVYAESIGLNLGKVNEKYIKNTRFEILETIRVDQEELETIISKTNNFIESSKFDEERVPKLRRRIGTNNHLYDRICKVIEEDNYELIVDGEGEEIKLIPTIENVKGKIKAVRALRYSNMDSKLYPRESRIRILLDKLELEFPNIRGRVPLIYSAIKGCGSTNESVNKWLEEGNNRNDIISSLEEYFSAEDPVETMKVYFDEVYRRVLEFVTEYREYTNIKYIDRRIYFHNGSSNDVIPLHTNVSCEIEGHHFDVVVVREDSIRR